MRTDSLPFAPCRYDSGQDGYIDLMELKLMMEKLGAPQTHLGLKNMIKEVDEDFDGKLSFREVRVAAEADGDVSVGRREETARPYPLFLQLWKNGEAGEIPHAFGSSRCGALSTCSSTWSWYLMPQLSNLSTCFGSISEPCCSCPGALAEFPAVAGGSMSFQSQGLIAGLLQYSGSFQARALLRAAGLTWCKRLPLPVYFSLCITQ